MPWFADFKCTNLKDSCGQEKKGLKIFWKMTGQFWNMHI